MVWLYVTGSPAPPTNGDYSALQQSSRKKKRKLEHAGSTSPELADRQRAFGTHECATIHSMADDVNFLYRSTYSFWIPFRFSSV